MTKVRRFSDLPPASQRLVRAVERLRFGRIDNLVLRDGTPVWSARPEVVCEVKLGSPGGPRPARSDDFELSAQWVDLFERLAELGSGRVHRLEVQNGLPFRVAFDAADVV